MPDIIDRMAKDLAKQLNELLDGYMATMGKEDRTDNPWRQDLREWLWDNKVGILRVLQSVNKSKTF